MCCLSFSQAFKNTAITTAETFDLQGNGPVSAFVAGLNKSVFASHVWNFAVG